MTPGIAIFIGATTTLLLSLIVAYYLRGRLVEGPMGPPGEMGTNNRDIYEDSVALGLIDRDELNYEEWLAQLNLAIENQVHLKSRK